MNSSHDSASNNNCKLSKHFWSASASGLIEMLARAPQDRARTNQIGAFATTD